MDSNLFKEGMITVEDADFQLHVMDSQGRRCVRRAC